MFYIFGRGPPLLAAGLLLIAAEPAAANTYTWYATNGGSFQSASSWGGVPGGGDSVLFNANATYTVSFAASQTFTAGLTQQQGNVTFAIGAGQTYYASYQQFFLGTVGGQTANLVVTSGTLSPQSSVEFGSNIAIGYANGSTGNLTVTGIGTNFFSYAGSSGLFAVGNSGIGTFSVQNNASATMHGALVLGNLSNGNGTVTVSSGGTLSAPNGILMGWVGVGHLAINGGGSATVDHFEVGRSSAISTVSVGDGTTAASLTVTNIANIAAPMSIGSSGAGVLNVNSGGTLTGAGNVSFASGPVSSGTGTVSGTWNQSDGAMYIGGDTTSAAGGAGSLTINNGGALTLSGTGAGITTIAGHGTLTINTGGSVSTPFFTNNGTLNLQGGILTTGTLGGAGLANAGTVTASAATDLYGPVQNLAGGQIINSSGGTFIFHSVAAHNGQSINTTAGGRTTFLATVTGTGPYTGTGTVEYDGTFQPGNSPAQVPYAGNLTFGAASALDIVLGGTTAGSLYDQLAVTGNATLAGNLSVALVNGFNPQPGQQFNIMTYGSRGSDFTSFTGLNLGNGETLFPVVTGTTYSLIVTPEPGTLALVGAAAIVLWRRSKFTGRTPTDSK